MINFFEKKRTKKNLINIYTPLKEAKEEIWRRWNDQELKKKVKDFLGGDVPLPFKKDPKVVLFRYIATPNFEYLKAKEVSEQLGLDFLTLEFFSDKFCTINLDKRNLGRMNFFHGKDKNNNNIISKKNVFDLPRNDGKKFSEIMTYSGEKLIDFHHQLLEKYVGGGKTFDISKFAAKKGHNSVETYPFFMALFSCFGILLEDYDLNSKEERNFVTKTVKPAFKEITKIFGVKPLIVKIFDEPEYDYYWNCYSADIKKFLWDST